jgi:hypothetical protein
MKATLTDGPPENSRQVLLELPLKALPELESVRTPCLVPGGRYGWSLGLRGWMGYDKGLL